LLAAMRFPMVHPGLAIWAEGVEAEAYLALYVRQARLRFFL